MSSMTNFWENRIIDWLLRGQSYTPPSTVHVALFTAAPGEDGSGGTELIGNGYARASVASSLANWAGTQSAGSTTASSGTGGQTSNNVAIAFGAPSASWGEVAGVGLFDAGSGGNLMAYAALAVPKTINEGDDVRFPAGSLTFTLA